MDRWTDQPGRQTFLACPVFKLRVVIKPDRVRRSGGAALGLQLSGRSAVMPRPADWDSGGSDRDRWPRSGRTRYHNSATAYPHICSTPYTVSDLLWWEVGIRRWPTVVHCPSLVRELGILAGRVSQLGHCLLTWRQRRDGPARYQVRHLRYHPVCQPQS